MWAKALRWKKKARRGDMPDVSLRPTTALLDSFISPSVILVGLRARSVHKIGHGQIGD